MSLGNGVDDIRRREIVKDRDSWYLNDEEFILAVTSWGLRCTIVERGNENH